MSGNPEAVPVVHVECETVSDGITGTTMLDVKRVEVQDDGSLTAVVDHWPWGSLPWRKGTPDVPKGGQETFWCAVRGANGKVFHRPLDYLNAYVMSLSDIADTGREPEGAVPVGDGDYAWTGWFEQACDQCETQWRFTDEVVAWCRCPRFKEG